MKFARNKDANNVVYADRKKKIEILGHLFGILTGTNIQQLILVIGKHFESNENMIKETKNHWKLQGNNVHR